MATEWAGAITEEEASLRAAVQSAERLGRLNHRRLDALIALAEYDTQKGRLCEAEPLWVKALSLQEKIFGPEHQKLAAPMVSLARQYETMGRYAEAEAVLLLALKIHERDSVENSVRIAEDLMLLARLDSRWGRWGEGDVRLSRAYNILRIVAGEHSPDMARFHLARGDFHRNAGRFEKSHASLLKAVDVFRRGQGDDMDAWVRLGHLARAQGDFREAETLYRRVLARRVRSEGEGGRTVSADLLALGTLLEAAGKGKLALKQVRRSLDIREKILGLRHPDTAESAVAVADINVSFHQFEEAETGYLRAWEVYERTLGPDSPGLLKTQSGLAALYFDRSCYEEADRLLDHLVRSYERIFGFQHASVRVALTNQRISFEAQERRDEVDAIDKRLMEMENGK
ncbi:MAG: tetratricopeptide repeat protein [Elusimicrobia bacterium]|nr:tetratricopeptide repeat protein [Elusimicrobiota bacterium]